MTPPLLFHLQSIHEAVFLHHVNTRKANTPDHVRLKDPAPPKSLIVGRARTVAEYTLSEPSETIIK